MITLYNIVILYYAQVAVEVLDRCGLWPLLFRWVPSESGAVVRSSLLQFYAPHIGHVTGRVAQRRYNPLYGKTVNVRISDVPYAARRKLHRCCCRRPTRSRASIHNIAIVRGRRNTRIINSVRADVQYNKCLYYNIILLGTCIHYYYYASMPRFDTAHARPPWYTGCVTRYTLSVRKIDDCCTRVYLYYVPTQSRILMQRKTNVENVL